MDDSKAGSRRRRPGRPEATSCAWCGRTFEVAQRGRLPRWCSDACRHRAWEQARATASGRSAVEFVERVVTVEKAVPTRAAPRGADWVETLNALARQLDTGALYERDFPAVHAAVIGVAEAVRRRAQARQLSSRR